jgi:hypothetical protein
MYTVLEQYHFVEVLAYLMGYFEHSELTNKNGCVHRLMQRPGLSSSFRKKELI